MNIIEKLEDLLRQATTERSHNYVASCCREAIAEIMYLQGRPTQDEYNAVCAANRKNRDRAEAAEAKLADAFAKISS